MQIFQISVTIQQTFQDPLIRMGWCHFGSSHGDHVAVARSM